LLFETVQQFLHVAVSLEDMTVFMVLSLYWMFCMQHVFILAMAWRHRNVSETILKHLRFALS